MMETDRVIALMIPWQIKGDYDFGTQAFGYSFATVNTADKVRNVSDHGELAPFCGLAFRCQASAGMCDGKPYAYSVEFRDVHSVNLAEAERMAKMLKRIEKIERSFPVRPETFGQFVQLVCHGLKVSRVLKEGIKGGRSHDETEYSNWKPSEIQWLIDSQITEFLAAHGEKMSATRL